jgi:hypothetical protein
MKINNDGPTVRLEHARAHGFLSGAQQNQLPPFPDARLACMI